MKNLTFSSLGNQEEKLKPVVFLGKRAYIKKLGFDAQLQISKMKKMTDGEAVKVMLAMTLCDSKGKLIFPSVTSGIKLLGKTPVQEVMKLFDSVSADNGLNDEDVVKN